MLFYLKLQNIINIKILSKIIFETWNLCFEILVT